jgi:hypothetical protein
MDVLSSMDSPTPTPLFNQRSAVPQSIIHTGEIQYTCTTCQKLFTYREYFMWHLMIQCGEKGFVCWSVGRHSLGRSVWRDAWDCTVVKNLSTVIVVRVSLWNVIWKDTLKDCMKQNSNLRYSSPVGCDPVKQQHVPTDVKTYLNKTARSTLGNCFQFYFMYLYILFYLFSVWLCVTEVFFPLQQCPTAGVLQQVSRCRAIVFRNKVR